MKKENNLIVWIIISVLAVLLFGGFGMMSFPFGTGMMYGFGGLFMILIVVALVLFIVWLIKELNKK